MRLTTAGSVTNARMRISPPQRRHTSTSSLKIIRSNSAQRRRLTRSAGHGSASCAPTCPAPASTTPRRRHPPRRRLAYAPTRNTLARSAGSIRGPTCALNPACGQLSLEAAASASSPPGRANRASTARRHASASTAVSCTGIATQLPARRNSRSGTIRCRCGCPWASDPKLCARRIPPGSASDSASAAPAYACRVRYATRLRSPSRRRS